MNDDIYRNMRKTMVEQQIVQRGIADKAIVASMLRVPRHLFIPENISNRAYEDCPQPIGQGQTISQPYIVASMIQLAHISPNSRVLDVGTGSGYSAAVLANISKEVFTIERLESLAETAESRLHDLGYDNVMIKTGDGTKGWEDHAPYDAILVAAATPDIPQALKNQLTIGGVLVIPIGHPSNVQYLMRITRKTVSSWNTETLEAVRFVPLISDN